MYRSRLAATIACFCLLIFFTASCGSSPMRREAGQILARGEDQLLQRNYRAAITSFKEIEAVADEPEIKAKALLGLGRACIETGEISSALEALYLARGSCTVGPTAIAIEHALGEALFRNHDYGLAYRHLQRALDRMQGPEKDVLLTKLSICAQRNQNPQLAEVYRRLVQDPADTGVQALMKEHLTPLPAIAHSSVAAAAAPARPPAPAPEQPGPESRPQAPGVLLRARWGAQPIRSNIETMGPISRVTIHHTGGPTIWNNTPAESAEEIRKIQKVHQKQNGWADIGYHYIIDRAGRIWQGRPINYQGAHARGPGNAGNIGVVLLGNFLEQRATVAQARSLVRFLEHLCSTYHIPPHRVLTHSEMVDGTTRCPGPEISRLVQDFRRGSLVQPLSSSGAGSARASFNYSSDYGR